VAAYSLLERISLAADGSLPAMGNRAAEWVRHTFSVEQIARQCLELYHEALRHSGIPNQ
jgi:hypothetical protein